MDVINILDISTSKFKVEDTVEWLEGNKKCIGTIEQVTISKVRYDTHDGPDEIVYIIKINDDYYHYREKTLIRMMQRLDKMNNTNMTGD